MDTDDSRGESRRAAFDEIETARRQNDISQAELARAAGLSEATYNKLVNDRNRSPYRRTVVSLRRAIATLIADAAA